MNRELERLVWRRAKAVCEYCRMPQQFDHATFEVDHIQPVVHGGKTVSRNLALSCFACNRFKGPNLAGIDPATGKLSKLFHPRRHDWDYHFAWHGARLIGRTAIGRATVRVLNINDPLRCHLRDASIADGKLKLG
ncbi:MAG: HNH endonuclease [Planctomycetaceae bacterium]|nr:HNH endonuclease [Planctomycetaceae bacterium]